MILTLETYLWYFYFLSFSKTIFYLNILVNLLEYEINQRKYL